MTKPALLTSVFSVGAITYETYETKENAAVSVIKMTTENKPKQMSVYLAHPYKEKDYGMEIMRKLESMGIRVVNPFVRGEQEKYDQVIQKSGEFTMDMCEDIVESDLQKIDSVDAVVALVLPVKSIGTYMEIFYTAYILHKPVFCLYGLNDGKFDSKSAGFGFIHPWIKYLTSPYLTEEKLLDAVQRWNSVNE